jgi:RNA polymerase sigma-70 factor (ECF subfamily)
VDTKSAAQVVEALIHDYYKLVFHTIYGMTGDWEESQDLTQDTFQQALKGIDAARAASGEQFHARAWLLRIAVNTVRMQQRRKALFSFLPFSRLQDRKHQEQGEATRQTDELLQEQAAPVQPGGYGTPGGGDPAEIVTEQDAVQRTMARLPEPMRVTLLLSIVGGLSSAEIATALGLKEAAVRQRLARARKQFQDLYQQESTEQLVDATEHTTPQAQPDTVKGRETPGRSASSSRLSRTHTDTQHRLSLTVQPPTTRSSYV